MIRQSFLQRDGWLSRDDAGWRLRVDTQAYDVLLQTLPWQISLIRLPLMTSPLFVDWSL